MRQQQQSVMPPMPPADSSIKGESSSSLIAASDSKSQLFSAFAALDLNDQYDAVLMGLCANKILDNASVTPDEARQAIGDPLQLLREMNLKRIQASPRSLMALIDVSDSVLVSIICSTPTIAHTE